MCFCLFILTPDCCLSTNRNQKREEKKKKISSATGFEPVRVNPVDFESTSLTTRTN